jgi:hypothetical protein
MITFVFVKSVQELHESEVKDHGIVTDAMIEI